MRSVRPNASQQSEQQHRREIEWLATRDPGQRRYADLRTLEGSPHECPETPAEHQTMNSVRRPEEVPIIPPSGVTPISVKS